MAQRLLQVRAEKLRLAAPFRIAGYVFEHSDAVVATISEGGAQGRGEASGVYYLGDDKAHMLGQIGANRDAIEAGVSRFELQHLMPPGGARNAPCTFSARCSRVSPTWLRVAFTRTSNSGS